MNILQITVILVVSMGFGDDQFYGRGGVWSLPLCTQLAEHSSNQSIVNIPVFWIKCYF